jgi:hypothetical protein
VCPEGKRPCAGVSPLTSRVLPDRCRVCRARSLLKGLSSGLGSSIGNSHRATALTLSRGHPMASRPGPQGHYARGPQAARQSYALRACHVRCSPPGSRSALASGSQVAAGGNGWLLMAVRGHLGGTPVMPRPGPARRGPGAPPLSPIGLTAAGPFAGGKVSRAASCVR